MIVHQLEFTENRSSWVKFCVTANDGNLQEVFLGENQFPGGNHFTARSILHSVTRSTRPAICRFPMPAKFWLCKKLQKRIYWIESKITTKLLEVLQDYLFAIWTVWITQLLYKQIYKRYIVCMYVLHTQAKKWNTSNAYFWQIVSMPLTQYLATNVLFTRTNSAQPYNWKRSIQIRLKRNVNKLARINFFFS